MSTLLDQFVAEGAELLDDATTGLLELERHPDDTEMLNAVFRAAHTFKGSSGLFEHLELTRVVHAAEDVLDALRHGELVLDGSLVDDVMAALDLARVWLQAIETAGELPGDATSAAQACIARLRARLRDGDAASVTEPFTADAAERPEWALALAAATPAAAQAQAGGFDVQALSYNPPSDCFFRGEDPLALIGEIPGLLQVAIEPLAAWPPLAAFDEYACALRFEVLTTAPVAVLHDLLRYVQDEIEIVELPAQPIPVATTSVGAQMLLDAQRDALAAPCPPEDEVVRLRSVADTVLRALSADNREPNSVMADAAALLSNPDRDGLTRLLRVLAPEHPPEPSSAPEPSAGPLGDGGIPPAGAARPTSTATRTIKVEQHKLDHLLELVGELVVSKNALPFLARSAEQGLDTRALARSIKDQHVALNRLTEELQAVAMDMRMLPVSVVFERFPRLIRDTARKLGKQVRLETIGEDTAADKDMLEQLADPLVHLVRNSLDHGLEGPDERQAAGKPAEGTITLSAVQQPDGVVIELRDDGRGVDVAAVRRVAYAKGLISEQEAETLDDGATHELLFRAGFSTAETVSDLSGRGVGMDAVRAAVVGLGGSVSLDSEAGIGTTARLRLPLSMAVTKVMVVAAAGQQFGLPVDVVRETVRLPRSELQVIADQSVTVRHGNVVPIVDLALALGLTPTPPPDTGDDDVRLLVISAGGSDVALGVERFEEHLDVIVKPLEGVVAGLPGLAGSTLLGDGQVLLILDVAEVLHHADQTR